MCECRFLSEDVLEDEKDIFFSEGERKKNGSSTILKQRLSKTAYATTFAS